MNHSDGDRISPQRQAAHRVVLPVGGQVQHDLPDKWRRLMMQRHSAQIYVPVRLTT